MLFRKLVPTGALIALCAVLVSACGGGSNSSGSGSPGSSSGAGGSNTVGPFTLTNLVADKANLDSDGSAPASHVDPNLVNPWGLVFATGAASWLSNEGSSTSTLYDGLGDSIPLVVKLPANGASSASPSGIVANSSSSDFMIGSGSTAGPASFIFDGVTGAIYGWSESAGAVLTYASTDGAVYTGLAIANNGSGNFIYAADFKNNKIDVFNNTFKLVSSPGASGSFPFTDPKLPSGYTPFGIQAITSGGGTQIYVAYAEATAGSGSGGSPSPSPSPSPYSAKSLTEAAPEIAGAGLGQVDVFDASGNFVKTLVPAGGKLNGPWGLALAPSNFGPASGDLLVGNFGDASTDNGSGSIDVYDPSTGAFVGELSNGQGQAIEIPGLWALQFGNGASGQSQPVNTLFFTAGTNSEADGTYGRIDAGSTAPSMASSVAITAPTAGATVSGTLAVTATVQDTNTVSQVQFTAAGTSIGTAKSAPFTVQWNSTTAANGSVELVATATDSAGNTLTSPAVNVTVDNSSTAPPPAATTLTELQVTFFTPICSTCHTGGGTSLPASQNLTAGNSFSNIVNVASVEKPSLDRIKPNDPTNSYLIQKIEGASGIVGEQMPFGCASDNSCLTQAQINEFISWVNSGAPNN
jgi:Big-like domain-containing protein